MDNTFLNVLIYCISALFIIIQAHRWYLTWRIFGSQVFHRAGMMLFFAGRGSKLLGILAGMMLLWAVPFLMIFDYPVVFAIAILTGGLIYFLWISQPPVILFLSSSTPAAISLFGKVKHTIVPLRVCALLDPEYSGGYDDRFTLIIDNMRIRTKQWLMIVSHLAEIVPLVVLDIRILTPSVRKEMNLMLQPNRLYKAMFHVGSTGREYFLWSQGVGPTQVFCNDEDLIRQVRANLTFRVYSRISVDRISFELGLSQRMSEQKETYDRKQGIRKVKGLILFVLEVVPVLCLFTLTVPSFFAVAAIAWIIAFIGGKVSYLPEEVGGKTSTVLFFVLIPANISIISMVLFTPELITLASAGYFAAIIMGIFPGYCSGLHFKYRQHFSTL